MTSILTEFDVFKNIDHKMMKDVTSFSVSKEGRFKGNIGLFVTKNDQVYRFELSRNDFYKPDSVTITKPKLMTGLSMKSIEEFYLFGETKLFFGRSRNYNIFAWSYLYNNEHVEIDKDEVEYMAVKAMDFNNDEIIKIRPFLLNYFALGKTGTVYQFTNDHFKIESSSPIEMIFIKQDLPRHWRLVETYSSRALKNITFDFINYTFATLIDNQLKQGYHDYLLNEQDQTRIDPKKVIMTSTYLYILSNRGELFYQSSMPFNKNILNKVNTEIIILDIFFESGQVICYTTDMVHLYRNGEKIIRTNYMNILEYYLGEYNSTYSTIHITNEGFLIEKFATFEDYDYGHEVNIKLYEKKGKYQNEFEQIKFLGSGGFARVYLVKSMQNNLEYAVKKHWLELQGKLSSLNFIYSHLLNNYI